MNVFLTGGTGFIGRHLVRKLEVDGRIGSVFCLYRGADMPAAAGKVRYVAGTLENAAEIRLDEKADVTVHLAGYWKREDRKLLLRINAEGTRNIIEMCRKNNIPKLVFISTINVKLKHRGAYADSKLMAEKMTEESGLGYLVIRPTLVYGEGDSGMQKIVSFIRADRAIPVFGKGDKTEQPIAVGELVEFLDAAITGSHWNDVLEIGGKDAMQYDKMLDAVARANGKASARKLHLPAWPFLLGAKMLETLKLGSPVTSEQIRHMTEDLEADNEKTSRYYDVRLDPFEENMRNYK